MIIKGVTKLAVYLSNKMGEKITRQTVYEYCNRKTNPIPYTQLLENKRVFETDKVDRWILTNEGDAKCQQNLQKSSSGLN